MVGDDITYVMVYDKVGPVDANRSSTLCVRPSEENRVPDETHWVSEKSEKRFASFEPAALGRELESQDECFALKSPNSVITANSASAAAIRLDKAWKKVLGGCPGGL